MTQRVISLTREGPVAIATIAHPNSKANTYDFDFMRDLSDCIEQIRSDDTIKMAILTGTGNFFCAGADIKQAPDGLIAKRFLDGLFDHTFRDMQRADRIPDFGVRGEIAVGSLGAVGANGGKARCVGGQHVAARRVQPLVN